MSIDFLGMKGRSRAKVVVVVPHKHSGVFIARPRRTPRTCMVPGWGACLWPSDFLANRLCSAPCLWLLRLLGVLARRD